MTPVAVFFPRPPTSLDDTDRQRYEPINLINTIMDNGRRVLVCVRGTF